jgi:hypothetical protein
MSYYIARNEHKIIKKHECFDRFIITCYVRFEHKLFENEKVLLDLLVPFSYVLKKLDLVFPNQAVRDAHRAAQMLSSKFIRIISM